MGGKGGDGDGGGNAAGQAALWDTTSHPGYSIYKGTGDVYDSGGNVVGNQSSMFAAPAAAAPKAASFADVQAPAPTPDPTPTPTPTPAAPQGPIGPSVGAGGAIDQPLGSGPPGGGDTGDALGGAVLKPPSYWVGGLDKYTSANPTSGRSRGKMTTTNT